MQTVTLLFELAVAVLLISFGSYLQLSGLPGSALAFTGLILGLVTLLSRSIPNTRTAAAIHENRGQGQ